MAAPKGNQFARKAKDWERALRGALERYEDAQTGIAKGQALNKAAEKVVAAAVAGDWDAIEHIANRLDGKPTEHVQAHVTHEHVTDMSDAELTTIARGSSAGTPETPPSETHAPELH